MLYFQIKLLLLKERGQLLFKNIFYLIVFYRFASQSSRLPLVCTLYLVFTMMFVLCVLCLAKIGPLQHYSVGSCKLILLRACLSWFTDLAVVNRTGSLYGSIWT